MHLIFTGAQLFPMLEILHPNYESPFNSISFNLVIFHIDSYAWIWSKYGLSSCSFQKVIALVEHMQMNSCQSSPDLSDWMVYHTPWFLGSGHSVDSVLAMCAHLLGSHMHFMPKSIISYYRKIMLLCGFHWHFRYSIWISTFVLLHCVWFPESSCVHKLLHLLIWHDNWFIASRLACMPNVHCILG